MSHDITWSWWGEGDVNFFELAHRWWMLIPIGSRVERTHMVDVTHEFACKVETTQLLSQDTDGKFQQDPDSNNPHKPLSKLAFQQSLVMEGLQTSIPK